MGDGEMTTLSAMLQSVLELAQSPLVWTLALIAVFTALGHLLAGYRLYRKIGVTRWEAVKLAVSDLPYTDGKDQ